MRQGTLATDQILAFIDSQRVLLEESQDRNFQTWDVIGQYIWPNAFVGQSFEEEVSYLKDWITQRLDWLDNNFPAAKQITGIDDAQISEFLVYPNPFENALNVRYTLKEAGEVSIQVFDLLGTKIHSQEMGYQLPDNHSLQWNSNDTSTKIDPGIYILTIQVGNQVIRQQKLIRQ